MYHRVGKAEIAEDLTAQVFVRMLEAIRAGRGWRTSFSGWLYRIAHNLVIDHYRRQSRASFTTLDEELLLPSAEGDPHRRTEQLLDRERLRTSLSQLTEEQAQVITLRFLEDLGLFFSELAQRCAESLHGQQLLGEDRPLLRAAEAPGPR